MSINWVMLHEIEGFIRLPHERVVYTSPPRTSLSLQAVNTPSGSQKFSINCGSGRAYLTNQRVVYLPAESTPQFQSFSAPLLNLRDTYVSAPFFGPNVWSAQVQPVPGGGIPPSSVAIQLKMTFKEGGAFDFHTNFERLKERLDQVMEQERELGRNTGSFGNLDYSAVHLEDLPAYEGPGPGAFPPQPETREQDCPPPPPPDCPGSGGGDQFEPPNEPPPGYEEVQQQSVANALEHRIRNGQ
ncbi:hypothetical protein VTO42DRAFT_5492 [Malbranchea cinnamomea]